MTQTRRPWSRLGLLALVTAAIGAGHLWYGNRHRFYDLGIYRDAMRWWAGGHPLYDFGKADPTMGHLGYTYPPFAAILMRPLAWIGLIPAQVCFVVATVAAGAAMVWWLSGPLAERLRQPRWFVFGLALVLATALEPVRETFTFGQINILLALLVLLDLLVLLPRGSRFAGVGIGVATAIKLVPGIFIAYLLVSRRYRAAAVAAATAVAATGLAFAIAPRDSWAYWTERVIGAEGVGKLHYAFNQSLMGVLARLSQPEPPSRLLWLALALPVLVLGLWRARRAALAGHEVSGLTLAALTGALVSPVTWVHHLVWFVPAIVVLVGSRSRGMWALAGVVYLTLTVSLVAIYDIYPEWRAGALGFLLGDWDVLLMLVLLVALPVSERVANYPTMPEKSAPSQKVPTAA